MQKDIYQKREMGNKKASEKGLTISEYCGQRLREDF